MTITISTLRTYFSKFYIALLITSLYGVSLNSQTTLEAGDIAIIGYHTQGSPDNFAILILKDLAENTIFYINDNEVATPGSTSFTDLNEREASFTVKSGQTVLAGTVIVLPWGAAAVSTMTYDWSTTSSAGLGNNNEELYVYTAPSITSDTPTAFIYYAKIGTSPSAIPNTLTLGTTAIAPDGSSLRYSTTNATYAGCKSVLLSATGNTAANWNSTGATNIIATDWTFSVNPSCATISWTGTLAAMSSIYGTFSNETSFFVSGSGMNEGILVTPPTDFEVSLTSGGAFTPTVTVGTAGTIPSTEVFIRLKSDATVADSPYSGNIVLSSSGASSININIPASNVSQLGITSTGAMASDKEYDGNNMASIAGATPVGLVNGDVISITGGGTYASSNVGNDINITPLLVLVGSNSTSYTLSQPNGLSADINPKVLTITGLTANNKLYDGTTTAFLSGTPMLVGVISGDTPNVSISGSYVANFIDPNVGIAIPVIVSGYTLSGSASGNYSLTQPSGLSADITSLPSPVITSVLTAIATYGEVAPMYTITATESPTSYNASGLPDGLSVNTSNGEITGTPTGLPGVFNVLISATNSGGTGNATLVYTINPKTLTVNNASADNKIYDRTNTATISGSTLSGIVGSDLVTINNSATFASVNIGTSIMVNSTQTLSGIDAPKYSLTLPSGLTADITPKILTIQGAVAQNKIYDGNTTATITGTLTGVISPDIVTLTLSGNFATSAVGNGIVVTSTSIIEGVDVGNYMLTQPTGLTANITVAIIANWTYEPLQGNSANPTPNVGTGTSALVGEMVGFGGTGTGMNTLTGCGSQTSGTSAWAISSAKPGTVNESSGAQFNTSTLGYENIMVSWEQRWSNTATNTVRLQYTTDGTNWINFNMTSGNTSFCLGSLNDGRFETNTSGDQYRRTSVDLSSISNVNHKVNFGIRVVAAHYQTTTEFRQTANPNTQATGGTWRFDNVKFEGIPTTPPPSPTVNLSVSTGTAQESENTIITITATASAPVSGNQTVNVGISGANITGDDYNLSNNTITILNGQTQGSVTLIILDDAVLESDETLTVTISNPTSGLTLGSITSQNIIIRENNCSFLRKTGTATSTNGAEIPAYDPLSNRIFVVAGTAIEYYSLSNTGVPTLTSSIIPGFTPPINTVAIPNSVAVKNGILAVGYAIQNTTTLAQENGRVAFYNTITGALIQIVQVGYLPDMIVFSPDGTKVLTADEGEPNSYGQGNSFDPEGSVSIIDISNGPENATVQIAGFTSFNGQITTLRDAGVRIFGPGATVAQDVEPEYIAFSSDGSTAFVTLQENNAFAELDIPTATITQILPLGMKNFNLTGNGFDASDRDLTSSSGLINIQSWPVFGLYQPDAIASYTINNQTYYITANEGDSRNYTGFSEEIRVGAGGYVLDPTVFPNAGDLKLNNNLGRLQVTNATGDTNMDGDFDRIEVYGARSFSIWNETGTLIYDSGDQFEQITATKSPATFNSEGSSATFDTRSDNKGPEPEGVTIGYINNVPYAFIGMERSGDLMVYNVSTPATPVFIQYINTPEDLAVEGLTFVSGENSFTKKPLLITTAEVSKTVTVYEIGTAIVTNSANDGSGTLRAVIGCVIEGGTVTYDQPTTTTTILTDILNINKSISILGLNNMAKPEITVDFSALGLNSGILIGNGKTINIKNVDFKDINNTNLPNNSVIEVMPAATLRITESTVINKQ
ncbi:MAG: choice-of-anchor I family protein [Saprospiraceae bacterium]|nr:choice-of-anchor I family protein [Saprospiraceae bacterium]